MSSAAGTIAPAHRVGPDYRPDAQKPTATISTQISYDNVHILPQTSQLLALLTYASPSLADIPLQSKLESSPLQDDPGQGLSVSSVLERLNVLPARSASDKWRNDHLSRSGNNLLRSNKPLI
ncbi:MAG: Uracil phosphoribosyltransferase, synthesizes UMP from uracil [Alectoria fallacina]|uniref:Uracil phosphoribosyltransferase, synthesizes UMP from uracil n=1 Tax=Alectoria fallacina TaxID=1903189 RepID=A0A8H3PKY7_9LECA|nr:MAG: Uracil phosphoribosyltransferase, synthesizes UMP from uracil [Alectoria fallacina]